MLDILHASQCWSAFLNDQDFSFQTALLPLSSATITSISKTFSVLSLTLHIVCKEVHVYRLLPAWNYIPGIAELF